MPGYEGDYKHVLTRSWCKCSVVVMTDKVC